MPTSGSTIWAQLASPSSPVGSVPFVFTDGVTIVTDVVYLAYQQSGAAYAGSVMPYQLSVYGGHRVAYSDTTAGTGNVTINKTAGRVRFAAAASSIVVTSNYCFATSVINVQDEAGDATATRFKVVPSAGSFTITANAAFTVAGNVTFTITNVY